jgi:hypothetical protein
VAAFSGVYRSFVERPWLKAQAKMTNNRITTSQLSLGYNMESNKL